MFWKRKNQFEINTRIGRHWDHA